MYRLRGECACPEGLTKDGDTCKQPVTVTIVPPTLPDGTQGEPYSSQQLTASGGTAPYAFVRLSGALPPGLTLSKAGLLERNAGQRRGLWLHGDGDGCQEQQRRTRLCRDRGRTSLPHGNVSQWE